MRYSRIFPLIIVIFILNGCASSFVKIEDSSIPLEGSSFIIQPPKNGTWYYRKGERNGKTTIFFGKENNPKTLSTYAIVAEKNGHNDFSSDTEFLNFVKNYIKLNNDPERMEPLESKFEVKDFFGAKTVSFYCSYKDHKANNKNINDFLILKVAGNIMIHPQNDDRIIQMDYSERGLPSDMDKNFKEAASFFFNSIIFKNQ